MDDSAPMPVLKALVTEQGQDTLAGYLSKRTDPLTIPELESFCTAILSGLAYLHSHRPRPVVHGSLTPHNILVFLSPEGPPVLKISGVGLTRFLSLVEADPEPNIYQAPELAQAGARSGFDPREDVFSFGIMAAEMVLAYLSMPGFAPMPSPTIAYGLAGQLDMAREAAARVETISPKLAQLIVHSTATEASAMEMLQYIQLSVEDDMLVCCCDPVLLLSYHEIVFLQDLEDIASPEETTQNGLQTSTCVTTVKRALSRNFVFKVCPPPHPGSFVTHVWFLQGVREQVDAVVKATDFACYFATTVFLPTLIFNLSLHELQEMPWKRVVHSAFLLGQPGEPSCCCIGHCLSMFALDSGGMQLRTTARDPVWLKDQWRRAHNEASQHLTPPENGYIQQAALYQANSYYRWVSLPPPFYGLLVPQLYLGRAAHP